MRQGKRFFIEYCRNFGEAGDFRPTPTRERRLVYLGDPLGRTETYDLLDDQCNQMLGVQYTVPESKPILVSSHFVNAHYRAGYDPSYWKAIDKWALWEFMPNIRVCGLRLCNFERARFAPICKWRELIRHLAGWITGVFAPELAFRDVYSVLPAPKAEEFDARLLQTLRDGFRWFEAAGMLIDGGRRGVWEGMYHDIAPDGSYGIEKTVRADMCGELSGAYFLDYLRTGNAARLAKFRTLQDFIFREMQIKSGVCKGLLRKSNAAPSMGPADHASRAVISTLLYRLYTGDDFHLDDAVCALDFLVNTTRQDGLRHNSVDSVSMSRERMEWMRGRETQMPCAVFDGHYMAALLLGYKTTGKPVYRETAERGMERFIQAYPNTQREVSETAEICRLILPAAWLYWVTGKDAHLEFLYRLVRDLERFSHISGAFLEWDTGYAGAREITASLLARNGDPVVDLAASVNWLPFAFIQAYLVTGDELFYKLWYRVARFAMSAQLQSEDARLHGSWARAFDPDLQEVYGMFHEIGWRPWAIKSGWTVAEILSGLECGMMAEDLKKFYLSA